MEIFNRLNTIRAFEKANLAFLASVEDFDIVRVIGLHQERASPLQLKQLYLEGIGSHATVSRRLGRLRSAGHVLAVPNDADRRSIALALRPQLQKIYQRYATCLAGQATWLALTGA